MKQLTVFILLITVVLFANGQFLQYKGNIIKKIAVLGDSITADGGYVQELKKLYPNIIFDNYGIAGESTVQILKRVRYKNSDKIHKILGLADYDAIIVLAGVNNIYNPKRVISDLQKIYNMAKNNPYKSLMVIAVTLTPWKGYKTWSLEKQQNTDYVNGFILSKPKNVDVIVNVYSLLQDYSNPNALRTDFRNGDKLHPRGLGQQVIGWAIFSSLSVKLGS